MNSQTTTAPTSLPASSRRGTGSVRRTSPQRATNVPDVLSNSEPTLRFPRPQGNRRLANWISTSNPDIMRFTPRTPSETSLADSTYELVVGTDTESQDGATADSLTESIDFLDLQRPDDVQSLSGTDGMQDEDLTADEPDLVLPPPAIRQRNEEMIMGYLERSDKAYSNDATDDESISDQDSIDSDTDVQRVTQANDPHHRIINIADFEASLAEDPHHRIINIADFEASLAEEKSGSPYEVLRAFANIMREHLVRSASTLLPGLFIATCFSLLFLSWHTPSTELSASLPRATSMSPSSSSIFTSSSTVPADARGSPPSRGTMDLIPLGDGVSEEWLFGPRKPKVSFVPQADTDILVRVSGEIQKVWLEEGCLEVVASGDERFVRPTKRAADEGILLQFPRSEAYGTVELVLKAHCRPKLEKIVVVHFGRSMMEEATDAVKDLIALASDWLSSVRQEAEHRYQGVCESLDAANRASSRTISSISGEVMERCRKKWAECSKVYGEFRPIASRRAQSATASLDQGLHLVSHLAEDQMDRLQDIQMKLRLGLLDAQISARTWWLRITGKEGQDIEYERKARQFMAQKQAAAHSIRDKRRAMTPSAALQSPLRWMTKWHRAPCQVANADSKHVRRGRGGRREGRGHLRDDDSR